MIIIIYNEDLCNSLIDKKSQKTIYTDINHNLTTVSFGVNASNDLGLVQAIKLNAKHIISVKNVY